MSKIQLICSDIDGTLNVNSVWNHNLISKSNINSIKEFLSYKDKKFILATGRDLKRSLIISDFIEKSLDYQFTIPYIIALNGGLIYDNINKKIIHESFYDNDLLAQTYNLLVKKYNIKNIFLLAEESTIYTHNNFVSKLISLFWFKNYQQSILTKQTFPKKIKKIMIILFKPEAKKYKKIIEKNILNSYVSCSGNYFLEIIDIKVNKLYALKTVLEKENLSLENVCAIGNEGNDLLMLKNAGFSSAVDFSKNNLITNEWNEMNFFCTNNNSDAIHLTIERLKHLKYI